MGAWSVGQRVYRRDVNENRLRDPAFIPPVVTVVKVGRTLVHVEEYGRQMAYGKDDGRRRDAYGHSWLQTFGEFAEEVRVTAALDRLKRHDLEFVRRQTNLTAAQIDALADMLDTFAAEPAEGVTE